MISNEQKNKVIFDYIENYRIKYKIKGLSQASLFETSSYSFPGGEIGLLVHHQLVNTFNGYGSWKELEDKDVLNEAYNFVLKEKENTGGR